MELAPVAVLKGGDIRYCVTVAEPIEADGLNRKKCSRPRLRSVKKSCTWPRGICVGIESGEGTNAASTTPTSDKLRAKVTKWTPLKGVVVSRRNGKDWKAPYAK